ncbi:MAG: ATP-binding cassette domain-containing protein [Pseudobutyrivibrio sp.]|jgi:ABC-type multidrug transport system ATPase subunit|uniref:ABC transporter ATP-binding protein n=1 Tax=Pseudobutyrivibrio sp. TaxID=2014367 RepID=UPI0025F5036B|nr:ATP-binding cassette domain-containing protein [Pseudobutyrivibrio sp.]MBE5903612.1 ATP-binding cassette domain-containing protein [Pseudobutyrivibrio sp.]
MIKLENCSKAYGSKTILDNINYTFYNNIYWLRGHNGIGKSVLCRCMLGLENFSKGEIKGMGKNVLYLPDTSIADFWLTVKENINILKYLFDISIDDEKQNDILNKLQLMDMDELASRLSVGTSMKIGLFLLFIQNKWDLIVLDETLSHIDKDCEKNILNELKKRSSEGTCIIVINHGEISIEDTCIKKIELTQRGIVNE